MPVSPKKRRGREGKKKRRREEERERGRNGEMEKWRKVLRYQKYIEK